ncbi:hypothetical protein IID22_04490, partial [Patescibacteria group bacterium]|nr:hypothetical protein [Patescibacteria group bacterium]
YALGYGDAETDIGLVVNPALRSQPNGSISVTYQQRMVYTINFPVGEAPTYRMGMHDDVVDGKASERDQKSARAVLEFFRLGIEQNRFTYLNARDNLPDPEARKFTEAQVAAFQKVLDS